ncbi:nuclear transport factor 2 family protein [Aspergillus homomorphus CBS 101889]|uniref:SnoaL-like domain-containing protein n=1 Tax=Aspergillus homomorphus (strain CBS 101889) TaxID=1450537 RepID=A0A395I353_ASPHC|nr:hypothetical protein BO97DRAFT_412931 [Aspergillus homomorphus CBS 101889]RAL14165.1 hypothetical protein BO97DRAFT_412931 [Aspergillus homomorphus CBS 101889]
MTNPQTVQHTLPKLSPQTKDAIIDPIYRVLLAVDTANPSLFASAIHETGRLILNGRIIEGAAAVTAYVYEPVSKMETTHHISNVRVTRVDEELGTASLTATVLAQHYRAGEGADASVRGLLAGGLYFVDVVRDEEDKDLWRLKEWDLRVVWREGDEGVMHGLNGDGDQKQE